MKAIRLHARGGPEQLVFEDAPKPLAGECEALVRVCASGITPTELTWSETYQTCDGTERIPTIPGHELSGVVEMLGPRVSEPAIGEAVYALTSFCRDGTAAEYVVVKAEDLAPKPRTLDHSAAAAVPLSALTAWQALVDHAGLNSGQRVLIHGAAGGVGTFAVQIAHLYGAHVIGTASTRNVDFVLGLGADGVVDYTKARFEGVARDVDVVLDTIGGDTLERSWRTLRKGGVLVSIVENISQERAAARGARGVFFIVKPSRSQLMEIVRLIDAGKLRPVIGKVVPLEQARQAFEHGLAGHKRGKIVLCVAEQAAAKA
jgi:NADPH:quinone reductase-like Zn-dependent oxidoreductase